MKLILIFIAMFVMIVCALIFIGLAGMIGWGDPKAGEVWRYEHVSKVENPFDSLFGRSKISTQDDSVIEVKDGWVQYVINGGDYRFEEPEYQFVIGSRKIR